MIEIYVSIGDLSERIEFVGLKVIHFCHCSDSLPYLQIIAINKCDTNSYDGTIRFSLWLVTSQWGHSYKIANNKFSLLS
jgi:hypothetical protein